MNTMNEQEKVCSDVEREFTIQDSVYLKANCLVPPQKILCDSGSRTDERLDAGKPALHSWP